MAAERVGVDVGGTFTDFVFIGAQGRLTVRKLPSTPADPSESVLAGLREGRAEGLAKPSFALVHGTTVATNALLERRGAKTALITTAGFRDVLEIGRQARPKLYALHPVLAPPLVPRERRFEVRERVDWRGEVVCPLDTEQAARLAEELREQGVESVAVCFLFSYLALGHEREVGALLRECGFSVSLSCEIAPEPREYERASTTCANAFVAPIMARYLDRLAARLREVEAGSLRVMQSDGGALSAREAAERAVKTVLSGPAGGVIAAVQCGAAIGESRLLTFDMGGTSTDVAAILDGQCPISTTGALAALPLRTPMLDIHTVGAGGGSLAILDRAGGLRVGPQSAGADPGPVAYGKGETLTVTDANVLMGRLPADVRLAGRLPLDAERVRAYFARFAAALGVTVEQAALGVIRAANAAMSRALRYISVERGLDPADFTLLSFGGAGGLHACALAEELGLKGVVVPRFPGAFSALGLVMADVRREVVQAFPAARADDADAWRNILSCFAELERQAARGMAAEGFPPGTWNGALNLDMRYVGQSFDLRIPVLEDDSRAAIAAFHDAHRRRYGHSDPREPVEIVAARLAAVGASEPIRLAPELPPAPGKPLGETRLFVEDAWQEAPFYAREHLAAGQVLRGPALILQADATTLLEPGRQAVTDTHGNLRITGHSASVPDAVSPEWKRKSR